MLIRKRWLVQGRVQGVFFRESTRRKANELALARGFVRNLENGDVEVVAEGQPGALSRFESFLGTGPPLARVERVTEMPAPPDQLPPEFSVLA